jgi:MFS transporter, SHS family, sialic acid transporter
MGESDTSAKPLERPQRLLVLAAACLGWLFAGMEISLFILIHRPMMLDLLGGAADEGRVTEWFAWFQATFLFGAAAGGWWLGWLGDRIGRTRGLGLSVLCYSVFTGVSYLAPDAYTMIVMRFLACQGIGGAWPNAVALASEASPDTSRPLLAGILGAAANVGFVLFGVIGYYVAITPESWRWTLLAAASPFVVAIACFLVVPESRRWLAQRRQPAQARPTGVLRELVVPPLLRRTLLGVLLGAIPVVGTAANASWLTPWSDQVAQQQGIASKKTDVRAKARTQITRSSGATLGSLLGGVLAMLVGRRLSYFLISLSALMLSTFIFGWLDPSHPWFQWLTFAMGFVGVVYFGWLPLFLPELFPTRVRATGTGISFNTGRVVAGVVVLSAGVLLTQFGGDYARIGLWTGLIYGVGMVIVFLMPRAQSGRLED